MNRLASIKCLLKGHDWGGWMPALIEDGHAHYRLCRRCGARDEHPNPRQLEKQMGWASTCPRCGRRGFIAGVTLDQVKRYSAGGPTGMKVTPAVVMVLRYYCCLECTTDGPSPLGTDRYWWEVTPKTAVVVK